MSKTTTFGDGPLMERLTNDEFLEILPYLSLEQYALTQVFVPKKKWILLLDPNLQTLQARCGVCDRHVRFEDVKDHLVLNDHLMSLRSNVKQFYHPFYTYGKIDIKLARGENAPKGIRESALREVNIQTNSFEEEYILAKQFSNIAERRSRAVEEEQLVEQNLRKNIDNPHDIIVVVNLPLKDISKLRFCIANNEWRTLVSCKNLSKKTTFHCNICFISCSGIECLNSHLYGYTHKLKQLELMDLSYEDSSRVNKNCCVQFGNTFSFGTKKKVNKFHRDQNENSSWRCKLPYEVAKMFEPLHEHALKMFAYTEKNLDERNWNEGMESIECIESFGSLGHLGVEYVLKIMQNKNDKNPRFECGLCESVGDAKKMQRHLLLFEHKKKYLDLHYPDTIKKYEGIIGHMSYKEFRTVMGEIVDKVAVEIENHHSRSLPYTVWSTDYRNRRPDLIAEAYALLHASQNRGPSFSQVVSKDDVRNIKNSAKELFGRNKSPSPEYVVFTEAPKSKIYLNQMSHDPVVRLIEYNAKQSKNRPSRTSSSSPVREHAYNLPIGADSRSELSHTRPYSQRSRSGSSIQDGDLYSRSVQNQNIWDKYRREIAFAANEIEAAYENYRKNPESHPLYEDEWNSFWLHRKKDLKRAGYNHRVYNFQPEWVHYFKQRIEVLFGESLYKSQIDIRHRLNIPLDAEEDCQRSSEVLKPNMSTSRVRDIDIEDEQVGSFKGNKRRYSPDLRKGEPEMKKKSSEQIRERRKEDLNTSKSQIFVPKINDNHSSVIHVLRLITALEEHLGSLGGRIMDLLSNALQLEKSYSENNVEFEAKVLTIANCNLLETALEKLKGILFSGLLEEKKIPGFNRVITNTANLLKYAEKMGWRQENKVSDKKKLMGSDRRARLDQEHLYGTQNRNGGPISKFVTGKTLSDTLMDLVKEPQATGPKQIHIPKEQYGGRSNDNFIPPVCPPPPKIKETSMSNNLFAGFKGQMPNSGLATFDTKLSLDDSLSQKLRRDQFLQSNLGQLHRKSVSGGNDIYNSSFKNNNETRTNINTRTLNGLGMVGDMNRNIGRSSQFLNSQVIPNMGQNKTIYQGVGGGKNNDNWLQWNH